jgi:hypothetical protein
VTELRDDIDLHQMRTHARAAVFTSVAGDGNLRRSFYWHTEVIASINAKDGTLPLSMTSKGTTGFELGNSLLENTLWEIDKLPSRKWPDI